MISVLHFNYIRNIQSFYLYWRNIYIHMKKYIHINMRTHTVQSRKNHFPIIMSQPSYENMIDTNELVITSTLKFCLEGHFYIERETNLIFLITNTWIWQHIWNIGNFYYLIPNNKFILSSCLGIMQD